MSEPSESVIISLDESVSADIMDQNRLRRLTTHVLRSEGVRWVSVGIVLTTHAVVRKLNVDFLGHDYETDVLSFEIDRTEDGLEGEVYVDVDTARERCAEFGSSVTREIERYAVHGLLHLAGYEDDTPGRKDVMQTLETDYLDADLTD